VLPRYATSRVIIFPPQLPPHCPLQVWSTRARPTRPKPVSFFETAAEIGSANLFMHYVSDSFLVRFTLISHGCNRFEWAPQTPGQSNCTGLDSNLLCSFYPQLLEYQASYYGGFSHRTPSLYRGLRCLLGAFVFTLSAPSL
jgi:hypothetical protein